MLRMNEKTTARIAPFAMDFVFSIYYLAAPLLLIDLQANPIQLGLVGTLASSIHMGMAHLMGHLSDRLGRRPLIIAAPVILLISCILMTQVGSVSMILALSVFNGLGLSIYWPSLQAWIADHPTGTGQRGLARDVGTFNLSWTAATLAGPILSGFLTTSTLDSLSWLGRYLPSCSSLSFSPLCTRVGLTQRKKPCPWTQRHRISAGVFFTPHGWLTSPPGSSWETPGTSSPNSPANWTSPRRRSVCFSGLSASPFSRVSFFFGEPIAGFFRKATYSVRRF
jgi:MFS family permease